MAQIDNIDPIKSFFSSEKLQLKIFNFLKKNNYKIINKKEYLDKSFDINITKGKPLPQIKHVGFLGKVDIKEIKSIQEKRTFKKLHKQINRVIDNKVAPITIDRKGYIINGHHRYDALRILGKNPFYSSFLPNGGHGLGFMDVKICELQGLLNAIENNKPTWPNFNDGLAIEKVMERIDESAITKQWLSIQH